MNDIVELVPNYVFVTAEKSQPTKFFKVVFSECEQSDVMSKIRSSTIFKRYIYEQFAKDILTIKGPIITDNVYFFISTKLPNLEIDEKFLDKITLEPSTQTEYDICEKKNNLAYFIIKKYGCSTNDAIDLLSKIKRDNSAMEAICPIMGPFYFDSNTEAPYLVMKFDHILGEQMSIFITRLMLNFGVKVNRVFSNDPLITKTQ